MKDSNTRHSIHKGPVQLLILGFFLLSVKTGWAQQTDKTKSLSLDEAVDRAIARASRVEQAQYEVDAQTEAKRGAWTNVGPHAQVQYQEARFPDQQIVDLGRGPFVLRDDVTKTGSLTVSQTITGLWAAVEYSRMKGKQADLSYEGLRLAKQDAGFGAAEAFLNAYQAQEQERIASSSIETAKRQYNDALALQRVGRQGQGDVLKFQLALSLAENRAAKAHAAKQIAMMALRQVIRAQDDEVFDLQKDLPKLQEEKIELQQGIESALTLRPELKQAELGTEIAGFSKKIAYAQYVPNLSVFKKWDKNFAEPTGLGGQKESNYIGLSLQWDIWSNGSSAFAVREAIARKNQADAAKEGATDGIKLDVVRSWENLQAARQSLVLAQTGVAQAEEAYRIDLTRFRNGQISATDLIKSETDKTTAQGQKVAAETEYLLWHFRLQRSIGKELPKANAAS